MLRATRAALPAHSTPQRKVHRLARAGAAGLLLCGLLASGVNAHRAPSTGLRTVEYAKAPPDFTFDLGSGPQTLASWRGKPVVINFFATYCDPCRDEFSTLERLRAAYGNAIELLTITDQAPGVAHAFLAQRGIDLPVVDDPNRKIFGAYAITPIPVTLVVRADGAVSYVSIGEMTYDELNAAVAAALASAAHAAPSPSTSRTPAASYVARTLSDS